MNRALVLAPHTDDGELGCGATISKMLRLGVEVFYVAFSSCKESLPAGLPEDTLINEMFNATTSLGIMRKNVRVLDFQVRYFERDRQKILDTMISLDKEICPDVVFCPSIHDIHQDHVTIATESLRAFKKKSVIQYELPWNNYSFSNQFFSEVSDEDVYNKAKAIACYKSQAGRAYADSDFVKGLLRTHGVQIGVKYAEVFEIPRFIWRESNL